MDKSTRILTNIILLSVFFSLIGANVAYDNSSEVTRIYGTVFDCKGNGTISGANVTAYNSNFSASNLTDADGNYVLHVPEDLNLSVVVKFPGHLESFKSIKTGKDTINMNFTLGQPAVTITAPLEAFINENFQVSLTFDNNATTPGFGPIVELILPPEISFVNANYMGFPVNVVDAGIFPSSGELLNPLTRNTTTGNPGYRLIIIEYPFGSFAPDQPPATITANMKMALNASLGTPLNITARPIFRFGNNPLDDPSTDPPVYGETQQASIKPTVLKVNKRAILHEDETATGPNYPFDFVIDVDVADGATLQNLTITDYLPANLQFMALIDNAGGQNINLPSTAIPGGNITIAFTSVTGALGTDRTIKYRVYAPEFDNNTLSVLDPNTGSHVNATNNVQGKGSYNGTDVSSASNYTVYLKSLAIQKSVTDLNGGYIRPSDILQYIINFQLSDYFQIKDIIINDTVGDGQSFLEGFTPILVITEAGNTLNIPFDPENYHVYHDNATGKWIIVFRVSDQLVNSGLSGNLTGGLYTNRSSNRGATTGSITFRTVIDIAYEDPSNYPPGHPNLKSGDSTSNSVDVEAKLTHNDHRVADGSGAGVTINLPTIRKEIYAINGDMGITPPYPVRPGDNVTFSLRVSVPTTNLCNFTVSDFLPVPFFRADQVTTSISQGDTPPGAGEWRIASDDTLSAYLGRLPDIEVDTSNNMIRFKYGSFNSTDQTERIVHILFTVTATDEPFADELYLTNQMSVVYYNSSCESFSDTAIQQILTQEPELTLDKRVNGTTGSGTIDPKGDLTGADAGDIITYNIIIENTGHWNAYNLTVRDNLPPKLTYPVLISVMDADGNPVAYTGDLFTTGIVIGMIPGGDNAPGGNDTIIIKYTARISADANPREALINTARITYYASTPGGPNFVSDQSLYEDNATVIIASPEVRKDLISSTEPGTSGSNLTIGEQGTFEVTIKLPEGEISNLTVTEILPPGLRYDGYQVDTAGFNGTLPPLAVTINGNNITFLFNGTTTVFTDNNNSTDSFRININLTVENSSLNPHIPKISRTNNVKLDWYGNSGSPLTSTYDFSILQPLLNITKTVTPNPARGRQTVTVRFNVTNNGLSPAYNITVSDVLNSTVFNLSTVNAVTTPAGFTYSYSNGTVEYRGGTINANQTVIFEFSVVLNDNIRSNSTFPNIVNLTYDSLDPSTTPDADKRVYNTYATTTLRTVAPAISKTVNATSEPDSTGNNVIIGEVVTYRIDITIPAGVTADVTVRDPIDARYIEYITGRSLISRSSGNITSDVFTFTQAGLGNFESITETGTNPLLFYLGNITNNNPTGSNETIRLLIQVVVKNNGNNTAGRTISNTAYLDYRNDAGTNLNTSSTAPGLTVRLPSLYVNKTSNQTVVDGGGSVKFTLTIGNTAGSNVAPLYDLNVTDLLDPWFTNIRDITVTKSNPSINVTYNLTGNNLTAYIDRLLQGQSVNITLTADLREDTIFGSNIPNTLEVRATSLPGPQGTNDTTPGYPGTVTGERTGEGGINNLRATSTITINSTPPSINKLFLDNSSLKESPIGNTLTHKMVIWIPKGRTGNLTVMDMIPTGLEASNFTYLIDPSVQAQYPDPTPVRAGNTWTINFGEVNATVAGTITIYYNITVLNITQNINNVILVNNATVTYYNGTETITSPSSSSSVKIVEPKLDIQKTGTANLNLGETCTWIIRIGHNATSTSNAYDITVEDIIPSGMSYAETVSIPPGWSLVIQPDRVIYRGSAINLGDNATIIFTTIVANDTSLAGRNLTNRVNISYTSLPGEIAGERIYTGTAVANTHILGTDLEIRKNATRQSPNYGETITYTVLVRNNGPDSAVNVVVEDKLPAGVEYLSHTTSRGIYDQNAGLWSIGSLNPYEMVTLNITVRINATGTIINYANVTSNTADTNTTNNNNSFALEIPKASDLAVIKTVDRSSPYNGETITYTVLVRNNGPDSAVNVVVEDRLPHGLLLQSVTASRGTYNSTSGVWSVGALSYLENATLTIVARVVSDGLITNAANATSENYDPALENNNATIYINSIPSADLRVLKTVNNSTPLFGDSVTFTITVENLGPSNATGVTVSDALSPGLIYITHNASRGTYNSTSGVWSVGALSYLENATLTIVARVVSDGLITNAANATSENYDPALENNNATIYINSIPSADLRVLKTVNNSTPLFGDSVTFTITVENLGPSNATGVTVSDALSPGLIYITHNASRGTYNSTSGVWSVGALSYLENATLTIVARVNQTGTLFNLANVNGMQHDPQPDNNNAIITLNSLPSTDLAITKVADKNRLYNGEYLNFTITVINNGPNTATSVKVFDIIPAGFSIISTTSTQGTYNESNGTWYIGALGVGESATLRISVKAINAGSFINTADVSGAETDTDMSNNRDSASILVDPAADLGIVKVVNQTTVDYLDTVKFTLTVRNLGPDNATGVNVTDQLPSGLELLGYSASQGTYDNGVWSVGDLASGAIATLDIIARVTGSNVTIVNVANVSSSTHDQDVANNVANVTINVPAAADLAINKTANQTTVDYLDTVKFTLTVRNLGPDNATGVNVTDQLPSGLELLGYSASQGTYDNGVWSVGDLASGAIATLDIIARVTGSNVTIVNVANVSSSTHDQDSSNNVANVTLKVNPRAELNITKKADRRAVRVGQNVKFTLTVINSGPDTALNTTVVDRLPDSMRYVSSSATVGSYNPVTGVWMIGDLPAGSTAVLEIVAQMIRRGTFINVATVSSGSSSTGNNTTEVEIEVTEPSPGPGPSPGKVPMKPTGAPLALLVLGILLVAAGYFKRNG
ncbi:hypothetical protein DNK57_05545 [Methanothermobacter thermautotrophicus]|uniref:DUF11 domain-containing protein n=2 Tax=Methanothermobacter thermautotrophicus TaxID=145262 RepID=A0A842YNT1_METTF|nr:hypothetical protein [Methanothermobacter thermautotrophicus]